MTIPVIIRGFQPRPWTGRTGTKGFAGTFVVLDMSKDRPVMDTLKLDKEFADEGEMLKASTLVGKSADAIVTAIKSGIDGVPRLVGTFENAK